VIALKGDSSRLKTETSAGYQQAPGCSCLAEHSPHEPRLPELATSARRSEAASVASPPTRVSRTARDGGQLGGAFTRLLDELAVDRGAQQRPHDVDGRPGRSPDGMDRKHGTVLRCAQPSVEQSGSRVGHVGLSIARPIGDGAAASPRPGRVAPRFAP
jgi:hypothetical protein